VGLAFLLVATTSVVLADSLQNQLDSGAPDTTLDSVNVPLTGPSVSVPVWLDQANGDGDNACNLDGSPDALVVNVSSSNSGVATFTPSQFTLTACQSANAVNVTVNPVSQGSATAQFSFDASSVLDGGETFVANTGNFTAVVDNAPTVSTTSPLDLATGVAKGTDIVITFSEPVNIGNVNGWITFDCDTSVIADGSGGVTSGSGSNTITFNPTNDFAPGETCEVGIVKNHVSDVDTVDGFNNMDDGYTFSFTVANPVTNTAPNITSLTGSSPYQENGTTARTFNFSFTDPDANTWSFVNLYPSCGTGGALSGTPSIDGTTKTGSFDCIFDDGPATPTVAVKISDGTAQSNEKTLGVSVTNVDPTSSLSNNGPVDEGSAVTATFGSVTDPSGADTTALFKYTFDCANVTANLGTTYAAAGSANNSNCTYYDNGSQTIAGRVFDKDNGYNTYTTNVTVNNVRPSITSAAFQAASTSCSTGDDNATLTVDFTDPGTLDTWVADIDWDYDGVTFVSDEAVDPFTTGDSIGHTYASAGSHTAAVQVTDDDGGVSDLVTATITVNYNLSAILQPINNTRLGQSMSLFKYGSTVPVKVEVTDCDGSHPTDLSLFVTWRQGLNSTPTGVLEVVPTSQADLGNQMRYSDPLYVLQLNSKKTTSDSSSGITIWVTIQETGQTTSANIGFK